MTRAQILRARRRAHHYDTPSQILHELHRIGSRWLWPALARHPAVRLCDECGLERFDCGASASAPWPASTIAARDAWRDHERLARRVLQDGCASAALWDLGRGLLVRAAQIARQARGGVL